MNYKTIPPLRKLKAFTLAEVLITLVIIGVIAAITIPTVTANHRKEETLTRLKKFYSTLNQALLSAQADGNNWEYWAEVTSSSKDDTSETVEAFAKQYVLPYMIYYNYEIVDRKEYVYLNDGSYFYLQKGACIDFVYDINGERKPNSWGRDKFVFIFCPQSNTNQNWEQNKITSARHKDWTRQDALNACKQEKFYCSGLLEMDRWQFKEDYPYRI